jgi:hypothetical protein
MARLWIWWGIDNRWRMSIEVSVELRPDSKNLWGSIGFLKIYVEYRSERSKFSHSSDAQMLRKLQDKFAESTKKQHSETVSLGVFGACQRFTAIAVRAMHGNERKPFNAVAIFLPLKDRRLSVETSHTSVSHHLNVFYLWLYMYTHRLSREWDIESLRDRSWEIVIVRCPTRISKSFEGGDQILNLYRYANNRSVISLYYRLCISRKLWIFKGIIE